ncbi:unnamed protein product [Rhizophagus irregularis]|nr:unnamed protein product [Rhizophagus irregularis]
MKSTETIIDQVNIVQDEASDVLILGKKNNLKRLLSDFEIGNNTKDYRKLGNVQYIINQITRTLPKNNNREAAVVLTASSSDNDAFTFGDKDMELFTNRTREKAFARRSILLTLEYLFRHTFCVICWRQKAGIATRERKNRSRTLSNVGPMKRKAIGRRGDGYVRDWAASEARPKWKGEQGTELINECCLTLPKIMKDIFINLSRKINFEEYKVRMINTQVHSLFIYVGAILTNLDCPKGYVCRYMKEGPFEIYADAKQCNNTLNALVSIIYAKCVILQTMGKFEEMEKSTEN